MVLYNFSFIIKDQLAGSAFPGSYGKIEDALNEIKQEGFSVLVSLTEEPLPQHLVQRYGFEYLHIAIPEFQAPKLIEIDAFVQFVQSCLDQKKKVLVHCWAGYGRTGTMFACYLVSTGLLPHQAIDRIRRLRAGSIETTSQEQAVYHYSAYLHEMGRLPKNSQEK
jgi:atypical dual specificity phosphatase